MPFSLLSSTSVAITVAPSPMKAVAMARPMPWPAAVTSATLPFSRPVMDASVDVPALDHRLVPLQANAQHLGGLALPPMLRRENLHVDQPIVAGRLDHAAD